MIANAVSAHSLKLSFFIQVMCWGVRNMAKYQLSNVTSPSIEFEIGGNLQASKIIRNTKKNPNFDENMIFFDIVSNYQF